MMDASSANHDATSFKDNNNRTAPVDFLADRCMVLPNDA
jgi:hypothetical protein